MNPKYFIFQPRYLKIQVILNVWGEREVKTKKESLQATMNNRMKVHVRNPSPFKGEGWGEGKVG